MSRAARGAELIAASVLLLLAAGLARAAAAPAPGTAPGASAPGPARTVSAPAPPTQDSCMACHLETGDARLDRPAKDFAGDIHRAKGFGCTACHGGNPDAPGLEAMDPAKGYIGKPDRRQVSQVCGRCHADARFMRQYNPGLRVDQVVEYATSVHGRRLLQSGDAKVATCVSCHTAHSIKLPSDPASTVHPLRVADTCGRCHADRALMSEYKVPTDQLEKYRQSVHGKAMSVKGDLAAPTCNDCHGNHGAAPPGVGWVGNVCGQCHATQGELFAKSVHARVFAQMGTPGCVACHENHAVRETSDEMLGLGSGAVCAACHGKDDQGGQAAVAMRALVDSLGAEHARARALLTRAEHAGIEVSQAQLDLGGAKDALVKARAAVHAFVPDLVRQEVDTGLAIAAKAQARGSRAMEELRFRRTGLVISVVIILALVVGLVLKIREVDRRAAFADPGQTEEGS